MDAKPNTLLDLARLRRSVRRFENRRIEPEKIAELVRVGGLAHRAFGGDNNTLLILDDPAMTEKLRAAAVSGWQGKINMWIYVTPFPAALVLVGRHTEVETADGRPRYLAQAAMVMETVVLAAAEMGLGTCWMAGFNPNAVIKELGLPTGWKPIIVSPLGYLASKGKLEMVSRTVAQSDRRKPLEEIYEIRGDLP